jgi:metal-sulfur cluster biosynthetic enzyme
MSKTRKIEKSHVIEVLKKVYDPDYKDKSIIDLGLVSEDDIKVTERKIEVEYRVTAPLCPFSSAIGIMIQYALEKKLNCQVKVRMKTEHRQTSIVNEILENESKREELLKKLQAYGILQQCVRI